MNHKKPFEVMHTLRDSDGLSPGGPPIDDNVDLTKLDRGDEVTPTGDTPVTEDEKKVVEEKKEEKKGEEKVVAEEDKDGKKEAKDTRVPLTRHKALLEAERAETAKALARLAQYEGAEDVAKTNEKIERAEDELVKLEKEHAKLTHDGKSDEAASLMTQIRRQERSIVEARSEFRAQAAESRAYERARYDITVERIEAAYPSMNPDAEEFDGTRVRKVLSIARAYQGDGMTPSAAIQEAVKDLLGEPTTRQQKTAVEVTPKVDDAAAKKAAREEEARRRVAEASGKQPPSTTKVGKDSDAMGGSLTAADVMKMSHAEFSKLDEQTLARLRGDIA